MRETARLRFRLRHKLIIVSLLLLILPTLSVGLVSYMVAKDETDELIESKLQSNVHLSIELIEVMEESVKSGRLSKDEAQEQIKTMLLGKKDAEGRRDINANIDVGENGYFFVLDSSGVLLAHPNREGDNIWDVKTNDGFFYIQDLIGKAQNGGGSTYYSWPLPDESKEAIKISYAQLDPNWGWIVAAGSYMQDYNQGQKNILLNLLVTLGVCLASGAVVVWIFARHISIPVTRVAEQARRIAAGDLAAAELEVRNRDEIGQLAGDFREMHSHLKELVTQVKHGAEQVYTSAGDLSVSIEETTKASREIVSSVQHIASGMDTQTQATTESSRAMEEMAAGIGRIAETSSAAYDSSLRTSKAAEEGYENLLGTVEQMKRVGATVDDLAEVIRKLDERSREVGEIVEVITTIAGSTSLLALNASIEAARAGEQGRGFAVVAGEVKKLAVQSETSAQAVIRLVTAIQQDIGYAVKTMTAGEREVREGEALTKRSGESFRHILDATRSVVEQIQEASSAAEQMSASSEQVAASLQEMARITEQGADNAQSISASTEEQLATMETLAAQAEQLNRLSGTLQQAVSRFRV